MNSITSICVNQNGSALLLALLILMMLTLMGISATTTSTIGVQLAGNEKNHEMAFYAAESGWQEALNWLDTQYPGVTQEVGWDASSDTFSPGDKHDAPDYISLADDNNTGYYLKVNFGGTTSVPGYGTNFRRFNYTVHSVGVGPGNIRSEVSVTAGKIFDTEGY